VTGASALTASNNVHHVIHVAVVQGEPGSIVARVGGRPVLRGTVQRRRIRSRWQRTTVSRVTNSRGQRLRGTSWLSAACAARSAHDEGSGDLPA
jgi:hypothetical protein